MKICLTCPQEEGCKISGGHEDFCQNWGPKPVLYSISLKLQGISDRLNGYSSGEAGAIRDLIAQVEELLILLLKEKEK